MFFKDKDYTPRDLAILELALAKALKLKDPILNEEEDKIYIIADKGGQRTRFSPTITPWILDKIVKDLLELSNIQFNQSYKAGYWTCSIASNSYIENSHSSKSVCTVMTIIEYLQQ